MWWFPSAKEGLELIGDSQKTFSNMVSEVGLAAAMRPKTEYTILAPVNTAFSSELFPKQSLPQKNVLLSSQWRTCDSCRVFEVAFHRAFGFTAPMFVCVRWGDVNRQESPQDHFGKPHLEAEDYPERALQRTAAGNAGRQTAASLHLPHGETRSSALSGQWSKDLMESFINHTLTSHIFKSTV